MKITREVLNIILLLCVMALLTSLSHAAFLIGLNDTSDVDVL